MRGALRTYGVVVALLAASGMARADEITVTLNTSVLINSQAGPFSIGFQLADGSLTGDGNNVVSVSEFQFGGGAPGQPGCSANQGYLGGVSGDLSSAIAATDLNIFALCDQPFTAGNTLSFKVSYSNNIEAAGLPDEFVMVILDQYLQPIPTTGGIALLQIDFNGTNPTVQVFAGDPTQAETANGGYGIAIPAPVVAGTPPTANT